MTHPVLVVGNDRREVRIVEAGGIRERCSWQDELPKRSGGSVLTRRMKTAVNLEGQHAFTRQRPPVITCLRQQLEAGHVAAKAEGAARAGRVHRVAGATVYQVPPDTPERSRRLATLGLTRPEAETESERRSRPEAGLDSAKMEKPCSIWIPPRNAQNSVEIPPVEEAGEG